jgi:hypothetical protein
MSEASEEQIAALQERVRLAGLITVVARWGLGLGGMVLLISMTACFPQQPASTLGGYAFGVLFRFATALLIAVPVGIGLRHAWIATLRSQLRALPTPRATEALQPLARSRLADTRRIVQPLLRELESSADLVPADAPTGRGDEPSAVE